MEISNPKLVLESLISQNSNVPSFFLVIPRIEEKENIPES